MLLRHITFFLLLCSVIPGFAMAIQSQELCHQKIRQMVCLVDPPYNEKDRYKLGRPCLPGGEEYAQQIIEQYDMYPDIVQKVLCSLRTIYIETSFDKNAWAEIEDGNPDLCMIGLTQEEMDGHINLLNYNSWFEQQTFGGTGKNVPSPNLPMMIAMPEDKNDLDYLTYELLHEIGHVVDIQNHLNQVECPPDDSTKCKAKPGSWTALSWINVGTPKLENDFPERQEICLNGCKGKFIPMDRAKQTYKSIFDHGFISQLASLNAEDDWAEAFTIYISAKYMDIHYKIVLPDGTEFNHDTILNSPIFREKKHYLQKTLAEL